MDRAQLNELHYIVPIANLPSIAANGLLSNRRARPLRPESLAMAEVQDLRAGKRIPGGLPLHDYVNLYICARNPMLFKRLGQRNDLCVLSIAPGVIDADGVGHRYNAASKYARYGSGPGGLAIVNYELTFAEHWTHDDPIEQFRRKAAKCAEVLVPNRVGFEFIRAAYVCGGGPRDKIEALALGIEVIQQRSLFFNYG